MTVVSVGLSRLVAQVHLPPEDGAEGEHAMARAADDQRKRLTRHRHAKGGLHSGHTSGVTANTSQTAGRTVRGAYLGSGVPSGRPRVYVTWIVVD